MLDRAIQVVIAFIIQSVVYCITTRACKGLLAILIKYTLQDRITIHEIITYSRLKTIVFKHHILENTSLCLKSVHGCRIYITINLWNEFHRAKTIRYTWLNLLPLNNFCNISYSQHKYLLLCILQRFVFNRFDQCTHT